jgi:PqqD family protein of HPr-rel-A system
MRDVGRTRWRLADRPGMRIERFADEALVFNPLTWETHLLNSVAADVLDALSEHPRTEADLAAAVGGREELEATRDRIAGFLRDLEALGLIERVGENRRAR